MGSPGPSPLRRAFLWLPPLAYAALIFHFSSQPNPLPELTALVWDKAGHAAEYGGLALLLCRAWRGEGCGWRMACTLAIAVACAYALSDEWHQSRVPGRDTEVGDWLADSLGGSIGAAAYRLLERHAWVQAA